MRNLLTIFGHYTESLFQKGVLLTAVFLTVFQEFIATYVFRDWNFLGYLSVAILVDTATGLLKAFIQKRLESRGLERFVIKIILYFLALVLVHVLKNYTVDGQTNSLYGWVDAFFYSVMMAREGMSILENIMVILPTFFPPWFQERFSQFKRSGKLSDLTGQ